MIRPDAPLPVSRTEKDPVKLRAAYEIGRQTALAQIGEIRQYLNQ